MDWSVKMTTTPRAGKRAAVGFVAGAVGVMLASAGPAAQQGGPGIYTSEQAARGAKIFAEQCVTCHREDLKGRRSDGGPPLRGSQFTSKWGDQSISALFTTMEALMPAAHQGSPARHPGSLTRSQYADAVSFLLKENGMPAGPTALPTDPDAQKKIILRFK
jgi:mono/diheme cytochrome c family protein